MKNEISKTPVKVVAQLGYVHAGIVKHGVALGFDPALATDTVREIAELILATNKTEEAKRDVKTARTTERSVRKTGRTFAGLVRDNAKPTLGTRYNQSWDALGFSNNTLIVPYNTDGVIGTLIKMGGHLTAHPEVGNTEANLTGERADGIRGNLKGARDDFNAKKKALSDLMDERGLKVKQGRRRIRYVLSLLELKVGAMDSIYLDFGFNRPGQVERPETPENLIAVLIGPNAVALKWDKAPRAEYYRVYKKVVGVDEEFVAVDTRADLDYALEGLPANATIEIVVAAVNNGGESAKSEKVVVQTE